MKIAYSWYVIAFLIIGGFLFWWYSFRPSLIIKRCSFSSLERVSESDNLDREDYEYYFTRCMRENGLNSINKANWRL